MNKLILTLSLLATGSNLALAKANFADNAQTMTHDCDKDPDLSVLGDRNTITVSGTCKRINVAGNENTITVVSTKAMAVSGNENTIKVVAIDQINVLGNKNTITWNKGIAGAKAKVSSLGTNNTISQAK